MATVLRFPSKPSPSAQRILAALPPQDAVITIAVSGKLATAIRRAAGWAGRSPEDQARAGLQTNFCGDAA